MIKDIKDAVNTETLAWDTQNTELFLSIFHPDMVWVWPKNEDSHDPVEWETPLGRFGWDKWKRIYDDMFARYSLIRNERHIIRIVETPEHDGGFAVVDIDTVWEDKSTGEIMRWHGRTCKTYVKTADGFKMIAQTGVLQYPCCR
jgi:hypothetical protein